MDDGEQRNLAVLQGTRAKELQLTLKLQGCLDSLARILSIKLENIDEIEIDDIPIRLLPQMLKSFVDGLTILQASHDRISGYGLLMRELERILEADNTEKNNH